MMGYILPHSKVNRCLEAALIEDPGRGIELYQR